MTSTTLERPTALSANPLRKPVKARQFLNEALDQGWSGIYQTGADTGGSPYVTVTVALLHGPELRLTWHTRGTGTYRLTSALRKTPTRAWHDITLREARATLTESSPEAKTTPPR